MDHPAPEKFSQPPAGEKLPRLFCAVELPADVRARAAAHAARLRSSMGDKVRASWEREEKMHVTLKFFGDVDPRRVAQLSDALSRSAARSAPFTPRLAGRGVFPSASRPGVLWLGVEDDSSQLSSLQQDIEDECERAGFPRDARRFHPHVTLARLRVANADTRRLARLHVDSEFEPVAFKVNELVLIRSELGARGSAYTAILKAGLG
jgi:RNA 2',3'-cyclic 3'-phosphodiesterase